MVWAAGGTSVVCVQPQEPTAGPVPMAGGPGPGVPVGGTGVPQKPRNRRTRLILVMIAGIVGLLCLGGVGVAISLYDDATKIERTAPDAVVDNFLRAYLVNRDDQEVSLYACKSGAAFDDLSALRIEMIDREKKFSVKVSASWSSLTVSDVDQDRKNVETDLVIAGSSNGNTVSRHTESWSFGVVDDGGWRVCSATKKS